MRSLNTSSLLNFKNNLRHKFAIIWIRVRHAKLSQKLFWNLQSKHKFFCYGNEHIYLLKLLSVRTWSAVWFLGRNLIWELCSMLWELTCSRSLWFRIEQNSFPRQVKEKETRNSYELCSLKRELVRVPREKSIQCTVNSEDLFQPQNVKLALRPLEMIQPTVGLFQPHLGQNWQLKTETAHNGTQFRPFVPAHSAPVNRAVMALIREPFWPPKWYCITVPFWGLKQNFWIYSVVFSLFIGN